MGELRSFCLFPLANDFIRSECLRRETIISGIYINIHIHSPHSAIGLVSWSHSICFHVHHGGESVQFSNLQQVTSGVHFMLGLLG